MASKAPHMAEPQFGGDAFHRKTFRIGLEQAFPRVMQSKAARPMAWSNPIGLKKVLLQRALAYPDCICQRLRIEWHSQIAAEKLLGFQKQ